MTSERSFWLYQPFGLALVWFVYLTAALFVSLPTISPPTLPHQHHISPNFPSRMKYIRRLMSSDLLTAAITYVPFGIDPQSIVAI